MSLRPWLGRTLLAATLGGAALLACEIAVRVFMPQPIGFDTGAIWEPSDGLRWRRRPNLDVRVNTGEREIRLRTDATAHRIGNRAPDRAEVRILTIGDSMVEALQVEHEQTMQALLSRSLSKTLDRAVDVVNGGVGGWDPNQYLTATREELRQSSYSLVVVFVYLENDIIPKSVASYPAATNLSPPPLRPFDDGARRTAEVAWIRAQAVLRQHSHLFVFAQNLTELPRARSGDRPHLLTNVLRSKADSPMWQTTAGVLEDIASAGANVHVPVLFILLPPFQYIDPDRRATLERALAIAPEDADIGQPARLMGAALRARGLLVFDSTPAFQQAYDAGERYLYGHIDPHLAPAGHVVLAHALEPVVLSHLSRTATVP